MWNKWKNHFSEMKGDVGMSPHEKEGEQEDAYTKTRNSFITPSLHLCFFLMCSYLLFVDKNTACMQQIDTLLAKSMTLWHRKGFYVLLIILQSIIFYKDVGMGL